MSNWQEQLIENNPGLFVRSFRGLPYAPGYPRCPSGWRNVVARLVERVVPLATDGSVYFSHMGCENGVLRIHWKCENEISSSNAAQIDDAIALAEARSACTCIDCGDRGRLFCFGFVVAPLCLRHRRGDLVPMIAGFHDIFLRRSLRKDRPALVRSQYDWVADAFVDISEFAGAGHSGA